MLWKSRAAASTSESKEQRKQAMLTEDIKTLIPRMAVPTIVAQMITTIYNIVDTYFVSTLGTNATAAVGVNSSLQRMITLIGSLIGAGACSYIARLLGAKREEDANRVLSTSFFIGLGLAVLFMIIGRISVHPLVFMLGATQECAQFSIDYATYVLYAAPFMIGSFILNMCLRSEGSAMFAMIGIGFGGILNCFLDPLFIYKLGLGVAGASMATTISQIVSFCILITPYIRKQSSCEIALCLFKPVAEDIRQVLAIGSTSFFRSAFSVVAVVLLNRVAGTYSTAALAAISVANRVMEFPFAAILGFGQGFQPIAGFNWGAKRMDRVKSSYQFAARVSVIGAVIVGVLLLITAGPIVRIFNSQADPEVQRLGILGIRTQCLALWIHSWGSIVNMFYAGIGKAKQALLMSTARQGYCLIPVLFIAPVLFGVNGIACSQAMADLLSLAVIIPLAVKIRTLVKENEAS